MLSKLRTHLTFANVASALALFGVLAGGTAVAVPSGLVTKDDIGANAVGRSEIKTGAVKKAEVGSNAVGDPETIENSLDTSEIENGSLLGSDFKPGELPGGAAGPPGPPGPQGPAGKDGAAGTGGGGGGGTVTVRVNSNGLPVACFDDSMDGYDCHAEDQTLRASCEAGERATGGGWKGELVSRSGDSIKEDRPDPESGTPTGWQVKATKYIASSGSGAPPATAPNYPFSVYAVCEAA